MMSMYMKAIMRTSEIIDSSVNIVSYIVMIDDIKLTVTNRLYVYFNSILCCSSVAWSDDITCIITRGYSPGC